MDGQHSFQGQVVGRGSVLTQASERKWGASSRQLRTGVQVVRPVTGRAAWAQRKQAETQKWSTELHCSAGHPDTADAYPH